MPPEEPTNRELEIEIHNLHESHVEMKQDVREMKDILSRLEPIIVKHETRLDFIAGVDGKGGEIKRLDDNHKTLTARLYGVAAAAGTALFGAGMALAQIFQKPAG